MRRGWVQPTMPRRPAPSTSSAAFGSWVVLPEPVSPPTMMTGLRRHASRIAGMCAEIGSCGGYSMIVGNAFTEIFSPFLRFSGGGRWQKPQNASIIYPVP